MSESHCCAFMLRIVLSWLRPTCLGAVEQVVEVISAAIGDMMRAEFTPLRDSDGNTVLPADGVTMSDWEQQTFLASGSLMSRSCRAALMLANHSDTLQQQAYEFGKQIALAYQVVSCSLCVYHAENMVISRCHSKVLKNFPFLLYGL